jgi:hypothetical protein
MSYPDIGSNIQNPNSYTLIKDYGIQTNVYRFYKNDIELEIYEKLFEYFHSGFIPMAYAIQYIKSPEQSTSMKINIGPGFVNQK